MNAPKNDEMLDVEAAHNFLVMDWHRIHTKYPKLKKEEYNQYVKELGYRLINSRLTYTEFKNEIHNQCELWRSKGL